MITFDTYEALGESLKAKNPGLTKDPVEVGMWYAKKFPDRVSVAEAQEPEGPGLMDHLNVATQGVQDAVVNPLRGMFSDVNTSVLRRDVGRPLQGSVDIANDALAPMQSISRGIGSGIDALNRGVTGVASGAVMGADKPIEAGMMKVRSMLTGAPPEPIMDRSGMAYDAGEIIGEIIGPYKILGGVLPAVGRGVGASTVSKIARSGAEAGFVEGGKAVIQGDTNPFDDSAIGFGLGAGGDAAFRGIVGTGSKVARRLLQGGPGNVIDEPLMDWLRTNNIPILPAVVKRSSNLMPFLQAKIAQNAAMKATMERISADYSNGLKRAKEVFVGKMGDNAGLHEPLESGRALYNRVTSVYETGKANVRKMYDELRETGIGEVPIDPNAPLVRHLEDGSTNETSMWKALREAIGDDILDTPQTVDGGASEVERFLHKQFNDMRAAHSSGTPKTHTQKGLGIDGKPQTRTYTVPGEPQLQDYNWWWKRLQAIGRKMDSPGAKQSEADMRLLSRAYGAVQDVIDGHASLVNDNYAQAISVARTAATTNRAYGEIPLLRRILKAPEQYQSEEMIGAIFDNKETVQEAKRILGPSDFAQARQAWLRNVFNEAIVAGDEIVTNPMSFLKFWDSLGKKLGDDVDSPFIREIFSENGYVVQNVPDKPLVGETGAAEKLELLKEFQQRFRAIDAAVRTLRPQAEELGGQSTLRGDITQVANPSAIKESWNALKDIMWSLVGGAKIGAEYVKPPEESIFMLKKIPEWEGNISLPGPVNMSSGTRTSGTSAVLNAMFNRPDVPDAQVRAQRSALPGMAPPVR